jgi:hypothetical protein
MPLPITLTLVLGAIAVALVGPALPVYLLVGIAVFNEAARFVALRSPVAAPVRQRTPIVTHEEE